MKIIIKYWNGRFSLAQSYWIGCVLMPVGLIIPIRPALDDVENISEGYALFTIVYCGLLFFAYTFLIIGAFKSATIYIKNKKKKKQGSAWGRVAQVALVLGALGIVVEYLKTLAS
jgi:hypothetical protein